MKVKHDAMLAGFTSLKVGGKADKLLELEPGDTLQEAVRQAAQEGPVWVVGYGTNCLISDHGLPGTVILNRAGEIETLAGNRFRVDSGVNWDDLVKAAIEAGLWGMEFASGIPGSVGAAVIGDIAAYGHKVADVLVDATVFNPADGSLKTWRDQDFEFDYRSSALQRPENKHLIVIETTFELKGNSAGDLEYHSALKTAQSMGLKPDTLQNRRKIILETRRRAGSLFSNPKTGPWTAGSFFKNPVVSQDKVKSVIAHEETGISADQIIRQSLIHTGSDVRVSAAHVLLAAGFQRGQTWGNVRLHPDHILKIENTGNATAQEMYDAVRRILSTVKDKLDIELEPEVRFLGEF